MQLKGYQEQTLRTFRTYLEAVRDQQAKQAQIAALGLDIPFAWDSEAWKFVKGKSTAYHQRLNGIGEAVPTVCFKIPTGGGKTLVAVKAIDTLTNLYIRRQTGLILWVVPTTQIYDQTRNALRDRAHPYRQSLDLTSSNRTLILEKHERFTPIDVQTHLVVLLLMLPSANRQNQESLRIFKDQGGFEAFFPAEDDWQGNAALVAQIPNLDVYDDPLGITAGVVKSSLGNTLRLLHPIIILDEGQKAYSDLAQQTLAGFNPIFILELSATPPRGSNILEQITGRQVHQEGMIKLDINLHLKATTDWRDVVRDSYEHRNRLEAEAITYQAETGSYIRPIMLIQVERTGKKQRLPGLIHAEDVREFLIEQCNVLPQEIAVKSSELDEIKQVDLFSRDCPIRYIITRQALQEGWDCAFAYVLTTLANLESTNSLTQLIGRVLRQPYARKTGMLALDESYVYCYRARTADLVQQIRVGMDNEGLGDVSERVNVIRDSTPLGNDELLNAQQTMGATVSTIKDKYRHYSGKVYLPCFVVPTDAGGYREIAYEVDILSRIPWHSFDFSNFDTLQLNPTRIQDTVTRIGFDDPISRREVQDTAEMGLDPVFMTRHLLNTVPNPWVAYDYVKEVLQRLRSRPYSDDEIRRDMGFVIEELNKRVISERRRFAKEVFLSLIQQGKLHFFLITGYAGSAVPERIRHTTTNIRKLTTVRGDPIQKSFFDVMDGELNTTEQAVALYLEEQYWVLAWYRNAVKLGYGIQGWQEHRVYADFVVYGHDAPEKMELPDPPKNVYVLETKGIHLKNSEDTEYKRELFRICEEKSQPHPWDVVAEDFAEHSVHFQVVAEDEWQHVLNSLFQPPNE